MLVLWGVFHCVDLKQRLHGASCPGRYGALDLGFAGFAAWRTESGRAWPGGLPWLLHWFWRSEEHPGRVLLLQLLWGHQGGACS